MNESAPKQLAEWLTARGLWLATAESVTAGLVANRLAQGPGAVEWFRGGLVAYSAHVKHKVLGAVPGPVVTAACAEQMARGVAGLLDAEIAVATTGVGGPDPEEGHPPGAVWIGTYLDGEVSSHLLHLSGDPAEVCTRAAEEALTLLVSRLDRWQPRQV